MNETTQTCTKCLKNLPFDCFYYYNGSYRHVCRECAQKYNRMYVAHAKLKHPQMKERKYPEILLMPNDEGEEVALSREQIEEMF